MSATLSFINISLGTDGKKSEPLYSPLSLSNGSNKRPIILRLVHPIILVGLVLGIIGGIDRMPESSTGVINTEKYDRGATLSKVSTAMFLLSFAAISFGVVKLWKARNSLTTVSYYIFTSMSVVLPLLFLRVLYSVLGAANLDDSKHGGHTDRFNIMNGSWAIYLILGFIPRAAIMIIYIASDVLAYTRLRNGIKT